MLLGETILDISRFISYFPYVVWTTLTRALFERSKAAWDVDALIIAAGEKDEKALFYGFLG